MGNFVGHSTPGALFCALIGTAPIGAANGTDGPERLEYAKWGALIVVVLGGLLGLFVYLG